MADWWLLAQATLTMGSPGVLHGSFSYLLQDEDGQVPTAYRLFTDSVPTVYSCVLLLL